MGANIKEIHIVNRAGIRLISIPWNGWDDPDEETVQRILALMEMLLKIFQSLRNV